MAAASAGIASDFALILNGLPLTVTGIAPQTTLLDFVRARGFTGAKEGCAEGECGACAVLLDGLAVNSCLLPLPAVAGRDVCTVEGLASETGALTDVQNAMIRFGGSQCGYCTPGFIIAMHGRGDSDPHALGGNLCRCTGYRPIADALRSLQPPPVRPAAPPVLFEKPLSYSTAEGKFARPVTLAECFAVWDADAVFVCGNTDLGVESNLRDRRFRHLISLEAVAELRGFRDDADAVEIGAAVTLTEIEARWKTAPPVIAEWLKLFASPLIRNRATLGGSLVTASPIGDSAPLLMALDARVKIASSDGERTVPLTEFFTGYRTTALMPGEILRSVEIPKPLPQSVRFFKVAKRRMDDISTVAAGIAFNRNNAGLITRARLAYGGVAAKPVRVRTAELLLEGAGDVEAACEELSRSLQPISDHRGSGAYRLAMAQNLLRKAFHA